MSVLLNKISSRPKIPSGEKREQTENDSMSGTCDRMGMYVKTSRDTKVHKIERKEKKRIMERFGRCDIQNING